MGEGREAPCGQQRRPASEAANVQLDVQHVHVVAVVLPPTHGLQVGLEQHLQLPAAGRVGNAFSILRIEVAPLTGRSDAAGLLHEEGQRGHILKDTALGKPDLLEQAASGYEAYP